MRLLCTDTAATLFQGRQVRFCQSQKPRSSKALCPETSSGECTCRPASDCQGSLVSLWYERGLADGGGTRTQACSCTQSTAASWSSGSGVELLCPPTRAPLSSVTAVAWSPRVTYCYPKQLWKSFAIAPHKLSSSFSILDYYTSAWFSATIVKKNGNVMYRQL